MFCCACPGHLAHRGCPPAVAPGLCPQRGSLLLPGQQGNLSHTSSFFLAENSCSLRSSSSQVRPTQRKVSLDEPEVHRLGDSRHSYRILLPYRQNNLIALGVGTPPALTAPPHTHLRGGAAHSGHQGGDISSILEPHSRRMKEGRPTGAGPLLRVRATCPYVTAIRAVHDPVGEILVICFAGQGQAGREEAQSQGLKPRKSEAGRYFL